MDDRLAKPEPGAASDAVRELKRRFTSAARTTAVVMLGTVLVQSIALGIRQFIPLAPAGAVDVNFAAAFLRILAYFLSVGLWLFANLLVVVGIALTFVTTLTSPRKLGLGVLFIALYLTSWWIQLAVG